MTKSAARVAAAGRPSSGSCRPLAAASLLDAPDKGAVDDGGGRIRICKENDGLRGAHGYLFDDADDESVGGSHDGNRGDDRECVRKQFEVIDWMEA